ncbi:MAG: DUF4412 domain-containing protein [Rhodanobacteraceae bacterium]
MEGEKDSKNIVMKVKGDKARIEINPQITTLLDGKTGDLVTLMNDQKKVMRISGERAKAMAEMASAVTKENNAEIAPKPTGKTETINGYQAEEYVSTSPHLQTTYWVAKNFPDYQSILQQMAVLQKGAFAAVRRGVPDYGKLPGMPLRTEIKSDGKIAVTSTLVSVNTDPVPDSAFDIPTDYTEMKMPDFLSGKKTSDEPAPSAHQ